jgi:hypothetical protein
VNKVGILERLFAGFVLLIQKGSLRDRGSTFRRSVDCLVAIGTLDHVPRGIISLLLRIKDGNQVAPLTREHPRRRYTPVVRRLPLRGHRDPQLSMETLFPVGRRYR